MLYSEFEGIFEDDAVELTASLDLETIDPDMFKFSASSAFDFMSSRISKTPAQKIEVLKQVKTEIWEKYNANIAKLSEKQDVILIKINDYKSTIETTKAYLANETTLTEKQKSPYETKVQRNERFLEGNYELDREIEAKKAILLLQTEDKIEDIDKQILQIEASKSKDFDLSEGAKAGCHKWLSRKIYTTYKSNVQTTAMKKGDMVEGESIDFLHRYVYKDYVRTYCNQERKENDFFVGRRDHVLSNPLYPDQNGTIDTKNVLHQDNFLPIATATEIPDKKYWTQGQVYLALWGDNWFEIVYTLMNMPDELVAIEAKKELGWNYDVFSEEFKRFKAQFIYDSIPHYLRIKRFKFTRDNEYIEAMERKVLECRRYIRHLINVLIEHEKNNCL